MLPLLAAKLTVSPARKYNRAELDSYECKAGSSWAPWLRKRPKQPVSCKHWTPFFWLKRHLEWERGQIFATQFAEHQQLNQLRRSLWSASWVFLHIQRIALCKSKRRCRWSAICWWMESSDTHFDKNILSECPVLVWEATSPLYFWRHLEEKQSKETNLRLQSSVELLLIIYPTWWILQQILLALISFKPCRIKSI